MESNRAKRAAYFLNQSPRNRVEELGVASERYARKFFINFSYLAECRPAELHSALDEVGINDPICCALEILRG